MDCWSCGEPGTERARFALVTAAIVHVPAGGPEHLCAGCRRRWGSMSRHPSSSVAGFGGFVTTAFPLRTPSAVSTN